MYSGKVSTGSVLKMPAKKLPRDAITNNTPPILEPILGKYLIRYKPKVKKLIPSKKNTICINQPAFPNAYSLMGCHIGFTDVFMKCKMTNRTTNPIALIFVTVNLFI
ncbi:hypothetical protein GCM10008083_26870 [Ulvibacter litoralis]|nr:hypothetical protein GCM10008083_26870 [Ulvibacter litoralis]